MWVSIHKLTPSSALVDGTNSTFSLILYREGLKRENPALAPYPYHLGMKSETIKKWRWGYARADTRVRRMAFLEPWIAGTSSTLMLLYQRTFTSQQGTPHLVGCSQWELLELTDGSFLENGRDGRLTAGRTVNGFKTGKRSFSAKSRCCCKRSDALEKWARGAVGSCRADCAVPVGTRTEEGSDFVFCEEKTCVWWFVLVFVHRQWKMNLAWRFEKSTSVNFSTFHVKHCKSKSSSEQILNPPQRFKHSFWETFFIRFRNTLESFGDIPV